MGVHTFAALTILGLRELHTSKCGRAKHFYQENDKSFFLTIHVSNWQITGFLQSTIPYLLASWIIWKFVVGCDMEHLHSSIDGGQNHLKYNWNEFNKIQTEKKKLRMLKSMEKTEEWVMTDILLNYFLVRKVCLLREWTWIRRLFLPKGVEEH